jgi:hypothetical protein
MSGELVGIWKEGAVAHFRHGKIICQDSQSPSRDLNQGRLEFEVQVQRR